MSETMSFGIGNWSDPCSCDTESYKCNDIVSHCDEIYISKIKDNDRHPHDSESWENLGSAGDILGMILKQDDGYQLSVPYHHSCGGGCVSHYAMGDTVAVESPLLNADGTEKTDECGNVETETLIYSSLVDFNIDHPADGAAATPATWTQGVSFIDYLMPSSETASDIVNKICADSAATALLKTCLDVSDPVTYTWSETNSNDGDGVIVWTGTPSDGSAAQTITLAEPTIDTDTDTVFTGSSLNPATGIVTNTFADADGNALSSQSLDLSALIASDHPNLAEGTGVQVAFDAAANEWTITNTVTDTDTFSTLSGGTLTLADGQTYDLTDTFATLSGDVLTLPSGQTYDLTDTDTFATLAGNVITFADGSTLDTTATVDTFSTLSGNVLTLPDGQTYDLTHTVDTDRYMTVVNNVDGSQSLQLVDIDGNPVGAATQLTPPNELYRATENTPDTLANSTTDNAGKALEADNLNWLLTNRSVAGERGVRNPDGSIGFYSDKGPATLQEGETLDPDGIHGGHFTSDSSAVNIKISRPTYTGQLVTLQRGVGGNDYTYLQAEAGAGLTGTARFVSTGDNPAAGLGIKPAAPNTSDPDGVYNSNVVSYRSGEVMQLLAISSTNWLIVSHNYNLLSGQNWEESENGLIEGWGNLPYNPAAFPAFTVPFTHIIEDAANGTFIAKGAQY